MNIIKNITKQNRNAKKLFPPSSLYFSRCLNLLEEFEWYFACFLDNFSKMNKAKISYKKSGVNISLANKFVKHIAKLTKSKKLT